MSQGSYYENIYFLAVARIQGQGIVVASYSHNNTETDIGGVKQVLEQPNMNMQPGKHYSFSVGQVAWHLIADESGLIYIVICKLTYPQRCAHACLEELQRAFVAKVGDKGTTAKERSLDKTCNSLMLKICQKYNNLAGVDKLAAVTDKIESVKLVMQQNVDLALQNCVKLDKIQQAAEDLEQQAGVFKRNANELKKKMWWKNMKMKLIIAAVILVILGIIIAVAVTMSKSK